MNKTDKRLANCSPTTVKRLALVVGSWGLRMLALSIGGGGVRVQWGQAIGRGKGCGKAGIEGVQIASLEEGGRGCRSD